MTTVTRSIFPARTPLIISGNPQGIDDRRWAREALDLAQQLVQNVDYFVELDERRIEVTEAGNERAAELAEQLGGIWCSELRRNRFAKR